MSCINQPVLDALPARHSLLSPPQLTRPRSNYFPRKHPKRTTLHKRPPLYKLPLKPISAVHVLIPPNKLPVHHQPHLLGNFNTSIPMDLSTPSLQLLRLPPLCNPERTQKHRQFSQPFLTSLSRIQALETENAHLRTQVQAIQAQLHLLCRDLPPQPNLITLTTSQVSPSLLPSILDPPATIPLLPIPTRITSHTSTLSYAQATQASTSTTSAQPTILPPVIIQSPVSSTPVPLHLPKISRSLSPPTYRESILALPVPDRLAALLHQPSVPPNPPAPVTSLIVRFPLSHLAQSSKTFAIRTAVHAITNFNILDANIIETNLFEIFLPLAVRDSVQALLQSAGVLQQPRPPLTAKDLPRRAFTYNRSRHYQMRAATLQGFSPDLQSQLLDLAQTIMHRSPLERHSLILRGLQRDRRDVASRLPSNLTSHAPNPSL